MPNKYPWKSDSKGSRSGDDENTNDRNQDINHQNDEEQERAFGSFQDYRFQQSQDHQISDQYQFQGAVAPSNASTHSAGQSSAASTSASTVQSSLFSRNAPTTSTMSTAAESSGRSKLANILESKGEEAASTAGTTASTRSQSSGRKMKVIDFEDLSEIDDLVADLPVPSTSAGSLFSASSPPTSSLSSSGGAQRGSTSNQQRNFLAALDPYIYNSTKSTPELHSTSPRQTRPHLSQNYNSNQVQNQISSNPDLYSQQQQPATISSGLERLAADLTTILKDVNQCTIDISRAGTSVVNLVRRTTQANVMSTIDDENEQPHHISLHSEPSMSKIIKVILHFVDNLLTTPQLHAVRMRILQSLYELGVKLKLVPQTMSHTVPYPTNFSVGSTAELPAQPILESLIEQIASYNETPLAEQEGAFIAPVLRGIAPDFAVLCLSFGFPEPDQQHYNLVSGLHEVAPDIHIYCQKNYIRACNSNGTGNNQNSSSSGKLKPPFRVLSDANTPPIGMSISSTNAIYQSGTLGGYIYPKVKEGHPLYEAYGKSTFAVTCGHVVLSDNTTGYPEVVVPSSVLVSYYKKTLTKEREKYPPRSQEWATYQQEIDHLDSAYPASGAGSRHLMNKPKTPLGQIAWGERKVVNGSMSDLAIIKCSPELTCRNYLGDDIEFSQYDPALMFGNLYVKRVVRKIRAGMSVFKYGSTSKYTTGRINGPRIVYWADGRLQTSEFVVATQDSTLFASGGDSGSWLLQKSEDQYPDEDSTVKTNTTVTDTDPVLESHGDISSYDHKSGPGRSASNANLQGPSLGVVGMLHSYDGEKREFGLITTMDSILDRLYQVTNVKWGVVGVPDDEDEMNDDGEFALSPAGGSESSSQSDDGSTDFDHLDR